MKKPGIAALIHPKSLAELSRHLEANEPLLVTGLTTTVAPLTRLPFLASLDALLNFWPDRVQVHLPKVADEASSIDVPANDARKLFENGMGLMFDHAHTLSPVIEEWLSAIRQDIGLSALTISRSMLYATPEGKGTAPHFDQNVNFVLQLHGTKQWWIAPNTHVENPLTRHTMGQPIDPELETYSQSPMPTEMPEGAQHFTLTPGTLLFVPRGSWHTTRADSDALSLNFTYTAPTWLDLLSAALRSRLALSPEWRETAHAVASTGPAQRDAAARKFDFLLAELKHDLPNWNADEILGATEG